MLIWKQTNKQLQTCTFGWITCGLLWCFYQLFGLSFWRHPFTAEDQLVSKSFLMKNQTHLGWPKSEYIWTKHCCCCFWLPLDVFGLEAILETSLKAILEYPQSSSHSNSIYKPSNVWLWHLAVALPTGLRTATLERTHRTC